MNRNRKSFLRQTLIGTLVITTTLTMAIPPQAAAMLAPAEMAATSSEMTAERQADLKTVQTALESKVLRQRLLDLKLTPEQIDYRLSQLSDVQIHQMAMQVRSIHPGGDAGVGVLVGLAVLAILVLFIVWLVKRV